MDNAKAGYQRTSAGYLIQRDPQYPVTNVLQGGLYSNGESNVLVEVL